MWLRVAYVSGSRVRAAGVSQSRAEVVGCPVCWPCAMHINVCTAAHGDYQRFSDKHKVFKNLKGGTHREGIPEYKRHLHLVTNMEGA